MRSVVAAFVTIVLFLSVEMTINRWLLQITFLPLILPFLCGAAFLFPQRSLFRLTILGAIAAELGSALPPGLLFFATLVLPHTLAIVLRHPRPDVPWVIRGSIGVLAVLVFLFVITIPSWTGGPLPPYLYPPFLLLRLFLPSAVAGLLCAAAVPTLRDARMQPVLGFLRCLSR